MEQVAKTFFHLIYQKTEDNFFPWNIGSMYQLVPSGDEVMADGLKQAGMNGAFMILFYWCFTLWDFTFTAGDDKQTMGRLMTDLKDLWKMDMVNKILNQQKLILNHMRKVTDEKYFYKENFGIEYDILRGRLMIEEFCRNLLSCSVMRCIPLPYYENSRFLRFVYECLDEFLNCGAADIVKLKKQIGILKDMIYFLRRSLLEILPQNVTDSNSFNYMNFVGDFSLKAACLACLYWAKEANEEAATEMNILLFDMMQKFTPIVREVTLSYFRILSSTKTLQPSIPIILKSFFAFFFQHLATTIPNDDFLIFRDQMICHFTILAYYAHENAEELSEYTIIFFSDFMTKVETAFAKARLHYYGFSDSPIGLEATNMVYVSFHPVQRKLHFFDRGGFKRGLYLTKRDFTFLRMFMLWLATCDDSVEETRLGLHSIILSLQGIWGKEEEIKEFLATRLSVIQEEITDLNPLFELERKILLSKLVIVRWLLNWFGCSLPSKPSTSNKIQKFMDSILISLNSLVDYSFDSLTDYSCDDIIVPFKKEIETLKDRLIFLHDLLKLSENCAETKELGEFNMLVQVFAIDAAFLTFCYWLKVDDSMFSNMLQKITPIMLSDMLQKITPITPDVARLYFGAFKAIYLQPSDSLLFGQTASIFVDIVFKDPVTLCNDDFQILRDSVLFLFTFLNDPPNGNAEELIHNQIGNHFWEDFYGFLPIDDMNDDFGKKVLLRCFMTKIETVIGNIPRHYCEFPDLPLFDLPKITSAFHLDFLIQNLRNLKERMINDRKFVPFAKYKIIKLEQELVSMSPSFTYIFELRNELNDIWLQVMNVLHLTECVINSCISSWFVFDHPIWYYMAYLSDIFDKIKVIKTKVEKIKENMNSAIRCLPHSPSVIRTLSKQARASEINEVMVGFEDVAKKIIDDLTSGHKSLDVVSIVGMGGLGKTTLAEKVCSLVKDDFHILAIYSVSQDYNIRMVLLGILKSIIKVDDEISSMTNDDLAHKLWKCLKRRKYLIVLDDIWSISAWNEVSRSFPDDRNGSRVMLTTRSGEVANKCKIQCEPFHLRFLSKVESWELLRKKVFQDDIPPSSLHNIGQKIAESCKGLPLSIVVIAGVLAGKERSESSWSEIAENVRSYLSDDERCMKILELSYNHLPEYLKPCLLYLGAYPEDKLIKVNHVIRLWIDEGFVQKSETMSLEDMAKEYFHNLVERSLLIVSVIAPGEGIKMFRVHDLIHNMCQTKCHEANFFKLGREISTSSSGGGIKECYEKNFSMYDQYRISVHATTTTTGSGSSPSVGDASTLFLFVDGHIYEYSSFMKLRLAQVLYTEDGSNKTLFRHMLSLVNLRHLHVYKLPYWPTVPSISNLWNLQSLILRTSNSTVELPETFWGLKSLRYVRVLSCWLNFSDHAHEQLDKVVSFSCARLSSAKNLEKLLQRLPAVRRLTIHMGVIRVEPLELCRELESFNLQGIDGVFSQINFPSTLKKLSLHRLKLPSTTLSAIAELHCLRVLSLYYISFMQPRLEMEDLVFQSLVSIALMNEEMIQWNASAESFPCLEEIFVRNCKKLEALPPCFGEISTFNEIRIFNSPGVESSALRIMKEQIEFGNQVKIDILKIN